MKYIIAQAALFCLLIAQSAQAAEALPGGSIYQIKSEWLNQNSAKRAFSQLAGRPRLIAMVFTRCPSACPLLVQSIKEIGTTLPVDLFSFDSDRDTAASLQEFAAKYRLDGQRWTIHTSSAAAVAELAGVLGVKYKKLPSGDFVHSNVIFLIGADGEILAKQEGLSGAGPDFVAAVRRRSAAP